jgi:hypothetical protein
MTRSYENFIQDNFCHLGPKPKIQNFSFFLAADYPLVIKDYVSYLKITLRINFKIKIEYVKLLF